MLYIFTVSICPVHELAAPITLHVVSSVNPIWSGLFEAFNLENMAYTTIYMANLHLVLEGTSRGME